ncbi:hypothetical protein [Paeniglutamicibacter sp.]|uniref:hypothetical protein n=1 Tax=Paeniglutamicibacter sp. TaxID=1934391 RepID=UPI003989C1E4
MGISVLLTALLTAFGAGDWNSAVVLFLVLLLAYFCGGYVAGRMARFNGIRQGVAVWVWAIVAALVVAGLSAIADVDFEAWARLNRSPMVPFDGSMGALGWLVLASAVVVPLVGAVLGGQAGMHHHRRIDRDSEATYRQR